MQHHLAQDRFAPSDYARSITSACGLAAQLSTTFFGLIVGNFGNVIGFLGIAAAALSTVFLTWSLMPETKPSNEKGELLGST
jgi:hypothetical protein